LSFSCRYIAIHLPDLETAEGFYRGVFGLDLLFRESEGDDGSWYTVRDGLDWVDMKERGIPVNMVALQRDELVFALLEGSPHAGPSTRSVSQWMHRKSKPSKRGCPKTRSSKSPRTDGCASSTASGFAGPCVTRKARSGVAARSPIAGSAEPETGRGSASWPETRELFRNAQVNLHALQEALDVDPLDLAVRSLAARAEEDRGNAGLRQQG
jgi:catechol 2,3-dioxygenase-like lactoylglutathione lyase family enzyme